MAVEQYYALGLIGFALVMFIWGRVRYDVVAVMTLLGGVMLGIVPEAEAFEGFGHAAVITVMAVLVISRALDESGVVSGIAAVIRPFKHFTTLQVFVLAVVVGALSAFMNNVGALALMLPVALQQASETKRSPSWLLMPLSFGSLLGGLSTLIGTPPNIIIATFRTEQMGEPFSMFDFAPVGASVAGVGILFIALIGWRFLPARKDPDSGSTNMFELNAYLLEVKVLANSGIIGKLVREFEQMAKEDVTVVSLIRGEKTIHAPSGFVPIQAGDVLLVEGDPALFTKLIDNGDLELGTADSEAADIDGENVQVIEAVIPPNTRLDGSTARSIRLKQRFGINLLAVAHQGRTIMERLGQVRFAAGDVLLLQGDPKAIKEAIAVLGCLPLATRELNLDQRATIWPLVFFVGAIGLAVGGILPIQISFVAAVVAIIVFGYMSLNDVYDSIEWPVVVLLGGMIPIGQALQTTGATELIAAQILEHGQLLTPVTLMAVLMVITMILSDVINNAVTAVVMAPIGFSLAEAMEVNPDAFLMAVAVASSSTFLTPIGHQSNTLVMGPGGYKFSDYWRMGLPLDIIIVATTVPLIQYFWGL